ncbi:hypothetical protein EVAR_79075_1 [Eumeta japonica]|uniref:Mos1 transposase HTH domain-containing protein n=1 Tax=Eumeta variegata TaxID=151549 RepID=A0A4C1ZNA6_EUMVA|nr:hypothetical protein EVAR_79075_1 [Eumeta japonica]
MFNITFIRGAADKSAAQVLRKERKTPKEILKTWYQFFRNLRLVYDGQKWARLFQQGRESCEDDPRPGRPVTVVTEENVRKSKNLYWPTEE